jgi:hypothetical protein
MKRQTWCAASWVEGPRDVNRADFRARAEEGREEPIFTAPTDSGMHCLGSVEATAGHHMFPHQTQKQTEEAFNVLL